MDIKTKEIIYCDFVDFYFNNKIQILKENHIYAMELWIIVPKKA